MYVPLILVYSILWIILYTIDFIFRLGGLQSKIADQVETMIHQKCHIKCIWSYKLGNKFAKVVISWLLDKYEKHFFFQFYLFYLSAVCIQFR